jgi:hypothetical protein
VTAATAPRCVVVAGAADVLPRWHARCLEQLVDAGATVGHLIVMPDADVRWPFGSPGRHGRLWAGCERLGGARVRALAPTPMPPVVTAAPRSVVRTRDEATALWRLLAGTRIDLVLDLDGRTVAHGGPPAGARLGLWRIESGDAAHASWPVALWEMAHGASTSHLRLVADGAAGTSVLREGWLRTRRNYLRGIDILLAEVGRWPVEALRGDALGGPAAEPGEQRPHPRPPRPRSVTVPLLGRLPHIVGGLARHQVPSRLLGQMWNVGVVDRPIESFLEPGPPAPVRWLPELGVPGEFRADPFGRQVDGTLTLLVERWHSGRGLGVVEQVTLSAGAEPVSRVTEIAPRCHASYPYLLEDAGTGYCVPETAQARRVSLWRTAGPGQPWEEVATLVDGVAALDPTVFRHDGRWWLLCTDGDRDGDAVLRGWWADALAGPWHLHALDPLKVDVRSSRPGGTPFTVGDRLYRPAQDCSARYGGRIVLNHVHTLTPSRFEEEVVAAVEPDPAGAYPRALHTLAAAGSVTLVDGNRMTRVGERVRHAVGGGVSRRRQG